MSLTLSISPNKLKNSLLSLYFLLLPINLGPTIFGANLFFHRIVSMLFLLVYILSQRDSRFRFHLFEVFVLGIMISLVPHSINRTADQKAVVFIINILFAACAAKWLLDRNTFSNGFRWLTTVSLITDLTSLGIYSYVLASGQAFVMQRSDYNIRYFSALRLSGLVGDPNFYMLIVLFLFPVNAYNFVRERTLKNSLAIILNLFTAFLTFSRSGWLAIAVEILLVGFVGFRNSIRRSRQFILMIVVSFLLILFFSPLGELLEERIATLEKDRDSGQHRLILIERSFESFFADDRVLGLTRFERIAIGVGIGNNYWFMEKFYGFAKVPHNTYVDFAIELGIFSLVFLLIPIQMVYFAVRLRDKDLRILLLTIAVGTCLMLFFLSAAYYVPFYLLYFLLRGMHSRRNNIGECNSH